jgi:hypothetical protein
MNLRVYLRRLVWFLAGIVALYLLVVLVENWTGARALAATKLKLEQAGETLDLDSLRAKSVPDDLNFCAIDLLAGITLDDEEHGKTKNAEFKKLDWGALWQNNQSKKPAPSLTNGSMLGQPFDFQGALAHLREVSYLDSPADASPERVLADIDRLHPLLKELSDAAPGRAEAVFVPHPGTGYAGSPARRPLPHLNAAMQIVKGLALRSQVAVAADDSENAVRSIQASLRLTQALGKEPTLIGLLVAETTSTFELNSIWSLLHRNVAAEPQLARLQSDLMRQDFMQYALQALRGELAFQTSTAEAFKRRRDEFIEAYSFSIGDFEKHAPSWPETMAIKLIPDGWFDHNAVHTIQLHSTCLLEPFKNGDAGRIAEGFDALERVLDAHRGLFSPHYILPTLSMPMFRTIIDQAIYEEAVRRQALVAIAIERYRLIHARLPTTLAELVPGILNGIPVDPIDGQPMRYRTEGDVFTLWSIALDRKDAQGRLPTEKEQRRIFSAEYPGDWVWKN